MSTEVPTVATVVDQLIALSQRCQTVMLRGNHEIMLLGVALVGWIRRCGLPAEALPR